MIFFLFVLLCLLVLFRKYLSNFLLCSLKGLCPLIIIINKYRSLIYVWWVHDFNVFDYSNSHVQVHSSKVSKLGKSFRVVLQERVLKRLRDYNTTWLRLNSFKFLWKLVYTGCYFVVCMNFSYLFSWYLCFVVCMYIKELA